MATQIKTREQTLVEALIQLRDQMQKYGDYHMAKVPPQVEKARENYDFVALANTALATKPEITPR